MSLVPGPSCVFLGLLLFLLPGLNVRAVHKSGVGDDLHLWIDRRQVEKLGGRMGDIRVIEDGVVQGVILDPNFENYLPTIPSEVTQVNFTWMSKKPKYFYNFNILRTLDATVLEAPKISIKTEGKIPKKSKGNRSGVAPFEVGLMIQTKKGKALEGTPIRLKLRKECTPKGPDPECDKSCAHGGHCNHERVCVCTEGYMGQYCRTALCYPQCMNGGNCTAPGVCSCPHGYQGNHCEGGICRQKCQNGGKCIQKDTCHCSKGYFGLHCEFSKCLIPCQNKGKCNGANKCRCPIGFEGDHCEVERRGRSANACPKPCRHGKCQPNHTCLCSPGWSGRFCQHKMRTSPRWTDGT